jgi:hypothetical protein
MDALDYWRLCDQLSLVQAALLIVGTDPSGIQDFVEREYAQNRPEGYDAVIAALYNAVRTKRLKADVIEAKEDAGDISFDGTTIEVEDLKAWLKARDLKPSFFFPAHEAGPDYLSPEGPHYSVKLAAAVEAWRAVSGNEELRRGKSVKQAIVVWLRQHANEFGLTKDDGNPNEQGIEDVAKIANWDTRGGAPKTPGSE